MKYANESQKERWLPGISDGTLICAVAMTEPGMGSDLAAMSTTAVRDGDTYIVNGSKTFITNGINSDLVIVAVKTDPSQKHKGMSLLVLERGMEGFERGRNLDKIGLHAQDTAELFFNEVRVPRENLLGEEGQGFIQLVDNLPQERLGIAAAAVAHASAALEMLRWRSGGVPKCRSEPLTAACSFMVAMDTCLSTQSPRRISTHESRRFMAEPPRS
jgi:alkylation response protein AidB-like acyl-CoA dehydrogenase